MSVLSEMYRLAPDSLCAVFILDDSRDTRCVLNSFRQFSRETGVPIRVLSRKSDLKEGIAEFSPDLCIVVGWYWIVNADLLSIVREGWLGIHGSLLPKYRGGSPLVWAIINGETESGVTLFYFDEGMDTGDIVAQKSFPIGGDETIRDILDRIESRSIEIIRQAYPALVAGRVSRVPQDHSQATYAAPRSVADGKVDWSWRGTHIYNFVRAQTHPYPGAFCFMPSGEILRIWKAGAFPYPYHGPPGKVVMVKEDHAVVTCGGGTALILQVVQVQDHGEQDAAAVLKFGMVLA
ncbi:MAG: methionyl-tRNA formyltransferase [Deltaproteobacteria bacterium]|nr:methionyl-tRNA formyltransferase [Deltaproteobacteria bacterium]